jgi:hypothetical protein
VCTELRKQNKKERAGQTSLFGRALEPWERLGALASGMMDLDDIDDATPEGVREKQARYERVVRSSDYLYGKLLADTWCAAFVWPKTRDATYQVTEEVFRKIEGNPHGVPVWLPEEVQRLATRYRFFHWHLQFPDVFRVPASDQSAENEQTGWNGGFDAVLGNPPWERVKLQEKEWFAAHGRDDIATAPNAAIRKKMIEDLADASDSADRQLHSDFKADQRQAEGESQLLRTSDRYPLCGRGDVNTYAVFAELGRSSLSLRGRLGIIVPSGIATDDTTKFFFRDLVESRSLASLYSFENEEFVFPAVHHATKFCLLTLGGRAVPIAKADFVFFARRVAHLGDAHRHFALTADDIRLLNPNTGTCPTFRSERDAEITKGIYSRVPVLIREGPPAENRWGITFLRMFDMATDANLFRVREQLEEGAWSLDGNVFRRRGEAYLPLYEAKMVHHFDHRYGTYQGQTDAQANQGTLPRPTAEQKADRGLVVLPRYWVADGDVDSRLAGRWKRPWLFGFRNVCRSTDERTVIASLLPRSAVGHSMPLLFADADARMVLCLLANMTSFAFDYVARQKLGGINLTYGYLCQLAVLPPTAFDKNCLWSPDETVGGWMLPRVAELLCTADDMAPLTAELDLRSVPDWQSRWDLERRFQLRCELDAAFFCLYGLSRDEVDHVMDSFWVVRNRDEAAHGEYRTARLIAEAYDAFAAVADTGASE